MIDLRDIIAHVGAGELTEGGRAAVVPGPGHSRRDRSLSIRLSDDGRRVIFNSFAGDGVRECLEHLGIARENMTPADPAEQEAARERREAERLRLEAEKDAFCAEVWNGTRDFEGSPGARYLKNRHLEITCPDIRFHPAAPRFVPWNRAPGDPEPPPPAAAMVCLARSPAGKAMGLHLTYVTEAGHKAFGIKSRLMMGNLRGAALRTAPIRPDGRLAVGEGVETCGAYSVLKGVPTWATFSTSILKNFAVPYAARHLTIAADNDHNCAGLKAARQLADRAKERCPVDIDMPTIEGWDWADVLERESAHA